MSEQEFKWTEDKDCVVVPPCGGVAVYTNVNGEIVVRQTDDDGPDKIITMPKEYGARLIEAIQVEMQPDD